MWYEINYVTTLIGRTKTDDHQIANTVDINKFISNAVSDKVTANKCSNVSTNGLNTVVNGSITDGIVQSEGVLEIASGAMADTLNIHTNATVLMDTGSIVTGRVLTYGGTISVASGVDVSEAEFDFNLTNLTSDNEAMLDNLQNAQEADFTVTIGCDQETGTYVLANGATGFNGEVKICGATYGNYYIRPGFADGELGTLAVGETLEIANQLFTLSVEDDALALNIAWASLRVLSVEADHMGYLTIEPVTVTAMFSEDIVHPEYSLDGENWMEYINGVTMTENGFVWFRGSDAEGNQSEAVSYEVYNIIHYYSVEGGDANGIDLPESTSRQLLEFSNDDYEHSLQLKVDANRVNLHALPSGTYCWQVRDVYDVEWSIGNEFIAEECQETRLLSAADDGNFDAFFGNARGVWEAGYNARHTGAGEWAGTGQAIALEGKNKIADIFQGANDASILLLTDDANGDALFVDDIYSAFPDGMEAQARIAQIDEIRAGAGDDVIDLTSQRFEYVGNGMTIHGGSGDDVIWANQGENILFGDAGNDQIIGASGNDIIAGGSGNDTLHGGGGDDIFTFSIAWGNDTVEQMIGGNTLLWFYDVAREDLSLTADANGNAVLSCSDDTVTILNVKHDDVSAAFASGENQLLMGVSLRFGYDGSEQYTELLAAGAFDGFTSEKIFEDKNKAMLA
ncbi:MAG: hypothetical protein IJS08_16200 [Victivallales bacterium]|nr:hypothetical protein [Victivallales bacterium]